MNNLFAAPPSSARDVSSVLGPSELPAAGRALTNVVDLVAEQARRNPSALAVVSDVGELSFGDLVSRAARLTDALRAADVRRGDRVAIAVERSPGMVVGLLAVLNAGAAYVPLDPRAPVERIRFMLQDSGASCLLLGAETASSLGHLAPVVFDLDDPRWARQEEGVRLLPPPTLLDGELAYCIFTSGTTGTPKAVAVSHGALAHLVAWHRKAFDVTSSDRALQFANLAFDAATWEIWGALCAGATLCLAPVETPSLAELADLLARRRVSVAFLPTPLVELLIDAGTVLPSSLRALLTGGDQLRRPHHGFTATLVNNYGPTECTVVATSVVLPASEPIAAVPPIGNPIDRIGVSLLDGHWRPVRGGEEGQLFLRGAGLARGYLGRPDLTAERFVPDPFGSPGSRMYVTGDLCRALPNGQLDYVGRVDSQVKLRGYRIELGEIEAALLDSDDLANAAAAIHEDRQGVRHLVAYVVPRGQIAPAPQRLAAALSKRLPDYMVPTRWVTLPALPLTANGKIDRRALPEPAAEALPDVGPNAVLAPLEAQLCRIWGELLGLASVPPEASFLSLGGSSIQAIETVSRLSAALGRGRTVPRLQGSDSIRSYAQRVESKRDGSAWPVLSKIDAGPATAGRGPLSRAQEQVCFLEHLEGAWRAYRSHALLRLRGAFDASAFEGAIDDLLARHDVLGSAFIDSGGVWHREQIALPPTSLPVEDLSGLPPGQREGMLARFLGAELDHRFELASPPVIRWWAARLSEDEHVILQSEHHNVHDGQSFRLMVRDLAELYSARIERRPAVLPLVEASYGRFCAEEREWLTSSAFQSQLGDWVAHLRDFVGHGRVLENRLLASERLFRGQQMRRRIDAGRVRRLREAASAMGASLFSLAFAAFGLVCGRFSRQDRFLIGTAVANRPAPDYRETVGMFVNAVAVRLDITGPRPFQERVLAVAEELDFALARSAVPMNEIVRSLNMSRALGGEAPFNVCFSFHDSVRLAPRFTGLNVEVEEGLANGSAKFDLNVVGVLDNEGLDGAMDLLFEYDLDRLPVDLVEGIASGIEWLLDRAAEAPQACLEPAVAEPEADVSRPRTSGSGVELDRASEAAVVQDAGPLPAVLDLLRELTPEMRLQADDDVFAAGLHSLLLMKFIASCRDRFGRELRMRDVYKLGTPRRIAACLQECRAIPYLEGQA